MRPRILGFIGLILSFTLAGPALALDNPPVLPIVFDIHGTPQPVPPLIDIGVVKPGRPQTITQPMGNHTGQILLVQSLEVVSGDFEVANLTSQGVSVPNEGSFPVTVTASGEGTGQVSGTLRIHWGGGLGWADVELLAFVDLVDASFPALTIAQTGFESGSPSPFGLPFGLPAPQISGTAALSGEKGAAIVHTGSTAQSFYHYFFPAPRELARTSFRFDPNSLGIPLASPETIAGYYDWGLPIAWLELRRNREVFQLRVNARLDNGATGTSGWVSVPDSPQNLTFDWWAGQPGAFEGGVRVRCGPGCGTELRSTGLNFPRIRNVRAGAVSGVSSSVVGEWYLDDLQVAF